MIFKFVLKFVDYSNDMNEFVKTGVEENSKWGRWWEEFGNHLYSDNKFLHIIKDRNYYHKMLY
jgi:hypothetical protein